MKKYFLKNKLYIFLITLVFILFLSSFYFWTEMFNTKKVFELKFKKILDLPLVKISSCYELKSDILFITKITTFNSININSIIINTKDSNIRMVIDSKKELFFEKLLIENNIDFKKYPTISVGGMQPIPGQIYKIFDQNLIQENKDKVLGTLYSELGEFIIIFNDEKIIKKIYESTFELLKTNLTK